MIRQKNETSIVKTAPPPWRLYIYKTNHFTKFHDDWAKNETSRVFSSFFYYINIRKLPPTPGSHKIAPPTGGHVFHPSGPFSNSSSEISIRTNVLSNFHDDWAKIVTSSEKTAPPTRGHVFQRTWGRIPKLLENGPRTTFELIQHIIKTNILTNFKLHRYIIGTNLLTKFHEYLQKRKTVPPTGGHVFQQTRTTF
ncbi:hypothetical protein DPMN_072276 [Dreissena polymorpha]|uniref:Uncharacterized protein n=1 Tax=Dreissena polymorpha TaxID=45954 RepID=A0A9D3Z8F6_DREPO|nr:hypothetical protein DPMN_072276 [Dreissena polymorpha]